MTQKHNNENFKLFSNLKIQFKKRNSWLKRRLTFEKS